MTRLNFAEHSDCWLLWGVVYGGDLPKGWYKFAKSSESEIEAGTDEKVFHSKPDSFYLKCTSGIGGNVNQEISGSEYAGKRIRLSAYLKSDNLVNDNGFGGQVWAYSYSGKELYMKSAAGNIKGTTDWKELGQKRGSVICQQWLLQQ